MKRAKVLALVIYTMLTAGTLAFAHYPDLRASEAQVQANAEQASHAPKDALVIGIRAESGGD
jgi:hypothetical protein